MTTFITGGAGFIGSNFAHYISDMWQDVVILDKLTYAGDMDNLHPLKYPVKGVDISYENRLEELFKQYKPKNIFHFAAETHVDNSINNVAPFVDTNVIGTLNLLNLSVKYDIEMFHHISTDEVYGSLNLTDPPFTEETPYDPQNPYAASKASSDHFVMSYHNILEGKKIPVYSKGENIRDWIYVEDHCAGLLSVYHVGKIGQKYNIGGECEMKNIDIVKLIIKLMNASEDLIEFVEDRPGHDLRYAIDNAKIYKTTSFQPEYNIEEGLKKTIAWYEKNRD